MNELKDLYKAIECDYATLQTNELYDEDMRAHPLSEAVIDALQSFYASYKNMPKYETIRQWETRTGEIYADTAPVWDFKRDLMNIEDKGHYYLCEYKSTQGWEWDEIKPVLVAKDCEKPDPTYGTQR